MVTERVNRILEAGILGLTLGILIYAPVAIGAVLPHDFILLVWMLVGMLVLWGLRIIVNQEFKVLWTPVCWGVLGFAAYAAFKYLQADIEYVARTELIQVIFYMGLFFAFLNNLHRRRAITTVLAILLTLGTLISIYAMYQYMTRSEFVLVFPKPAQYAGRASGTYICPNHLAGFLAMVLPVGVSLLLSGRMSYIARILVGYSVLMMTAALRVTVSRAGWFAAGAGVFFVVVALLHKRRFWLPVTILAMILIFVGLYLYSHSFTAKKRVEENRLLVPDENRRILYWRGAIDVFKQSPVFGVGPGHYDYRYRQVRQPLNVAQGRPGWVHNDYLNTLVDYGVVGFSIILIVLAVLVYTAVQSWNSVKRRIESGKTSNKGSIMLGVAGGLVGLGVHSFFDFNMHIPANAAIAIVFIAILTSYWRYSTERCWISTRGVSKAIALLCLFVFSATLLLAAVPRYKESKFLKLANETLSESDTIKYLKEAYKIEPQNFETSYTIGELIRNRSWQGGDDYKELALVAIAWFRKGMDANPLDPYPFLRYGMCLDWIGRRAEAGVYFKRALELDPNSYYMLAHAGWHYFQVEDYKKAQEMFMRSLKLNWWDNPLPVLYLRIMEERKLIKD
ncbi:MAG: O-antigen ligase family protein [Verrucomicrobiae bacterium]|nr:O-antigen ligase family protein [Verrucomicrobiae bacterium]